MAEQDQPADLTSLTRSNALKWLESLRERGQNTGTIRTRWRGLRRFTARLVAEEIIGTDPLAGIAVDKPEPPPVPILTDAETEPRSVAPLPLLPRHPPWPCHRN